MDFKELRKAKISHKHLKRTEQDKVRAALLFRLLSLPLNSSAFPFSSHCNFTVRLKHKYLSSDPKTSTGEISLQLFFSSGFLAIRPGATVHTPSRLSNCGFLNSSVMFAPPQLDSLCYPPENICKTSDS